ncbi:MAG TPA: hypothetical protein VK081_08930, partial [Planctomycetota bacterium]|nr:hypothetical protein [Planctomycetota bacterium]
LVLRTYPRDYYFAPLGVLGALACTALPRWVAAALAVLLAAGNVVQLAQPKERFPWQEQMGMAGRFLREVVPPGEPVGSFNSGIVAFHDPGPVVNLDGVVHRAAFEALRAGDLDAWLDRRGIRFLVDSAIQFAIDGPWPHSSGAHFGAGFAPTRDLVELARCVVPGVEQPFVVYHRRGRGAPPPPPEKARVLGPAPAEGGRRAGAWVLWPAHGPDALALRAADGSGDSIQLVTVDRPTAVLVRVDAPRPGRWALVAGDGSEVLALDL